MSSIFSQSGVKLPKLRGVDNVDMPSIARNFDLYKYEPAKAETFYTKGADAVPKQYGVPLYSQPSSLSESVVRDVMLQGTQFSNRANKAISIAEDPAGATKAFVNDLNRINAMAPDLGQKMLGIVDSALPDVDLRKKDFVSSKMFKAAHGEMQAMLIQDNYPAYQKLAKLGGVPVTKRGLKLATKRIAKRGKKTGGKTHRKKK